MFCAWQKPAADASLHLIEVSSENYWLSNVNKKNAIKFHYANYNWELIVAKISTSNCLIELSSKVCSLPKGFFFWKLFTIKIYFLLFESKVVSKLKLNLRIAHASYLLGRFMYEFSHFVFVDRDKPSWIMV